MDALGFIPTGCRTELKRGDVKMNIPSLSAGTGPAAAILIGGVLILFGKYELGIVLIGVGVLLSLIWAGLFKNF